MELKPEWIDDLKIEYGDSPLVMNGRPQLTATVVLRLDEYQAIAALLELVQQATT